MSDTTVKTVAVKLKTDGYDDSRLKIEKLSVAADDLSRKHPEITPQVDSAKALLEARLLRDGVKKELTKVTMDVGSSGSGANWLEKLTGFGAGSGGGGIGSILGSGGSGGGSIVGSIGDIGGGAGWAAIAAAVAALSVEITGVVAGLTAATAGVGAFGLLALPTFDRIKNAYTGISAAQGKYNAALAMEKQDPTKANATAAATALDRLKVAQDNLSPSTRTAVSGIQSLIASFDKMALAFQPTVMTVFNAALKAANNLLPALKPMADAAGGAIAGLLKQFDKFTQSTGFKDWIAKFTSLIGPSLTTIGHGVANVTVNIGKLLMVMSRQDVVRALGLAFRVLSDTIRVVTLGVEGIMRVFDFLTSSIKGQMLGILRAAAAGFGWIPGIGPELRKALGAFEGFAGGVNSGLASIDSNAALTSAALAGVANAALNAMSTGALGGAVPSGGLKRRASGGLTSGLTLVGEMGPELLQVPSGSQVYSNRQSSQMLGGNHYHITVNVPVSANKRDVGREIVGAIKSFEEGSGKSWRR